MGPLAMRPTVGWFFWADAAVPLRWFTVKTEAAYYTSPDKRQDEYVIYVIQFERQIKELSLVAGRWVPASIVAIRRTGPNTAIADVRMSFEPSQVFQEFETAFEQIQSPGLALMLGGIRKQGKLAHVTFQRYADGWHVESVE